MRTERQIDVYLRQRARVQTPLRARWPLGNRCRRGGRPMPSGGPARRRGCWSSRAASPRRGSTGSSTAHGTAPTPGQLAGRGVFAVAAHRPAPPARAIDLASIRDRAESRQTVPRTSTETPKQTPPLGEVSVSRGAGSLGLDSVFERLSVHGQPRPRVSHIICGLAINHPRPAHVAGLGSHRCDP